MKTPTHKKLIAIATPIPVEELEAALDKEQEALRNFPQWRDLPRAGFFSGLILARELATPWDELVAMPGEELKAAADKEQETRDFAQTVELGDQLDRVYRLAAERNTSGLLKEFVIAYLVHQNDINNRFLVRFINAERRRRAAERRWRGRTPLKTLGKLSIPEQRAQAMQYYEEDLVAKHGHTYADRILLDMIREAGAWPHLFPASMDDEELFTSISAGRTALGIKKPRPAKRKHTP